MDVVLFSGGVDSLVSVLMLRKEGKNPKCLYVLLGHRYENEEMNTIERFKRELNLDLDMVGLKGIGRFEKPDAEIPLRNLLLIEIAAIVGGKVIYLSVEEGTFQNESRDRSPEFMSRVERLLSWMFDSDIIVRNLVGEMTKQDEMEWVLKNYGDYGGRLLGMTFSCYSPIDGRMCGNCKACVRWFLAAEGARIKRDDWVSYPGNSDIVKEYVGGVRYGRYVGRRAEQYKELFQRKGWMS